MSNISNSGLIAGDLIDSSGSTSSAGAAKPEGGLQVLPFYIVCDESSSMDGASIAAVNDLTDCSASVEKYSATRINTSSNFPVASPVATI